MVELHRATMDQGVMHMRPVPDGLPLPADQAVTLAPGGLHVMLMQLKHPLRQGETFPLILTFAHAAPLTVQVAVEAAGAGSPAMHPAPAGHGDMNMGTMKP